MINNKYNNYKGKVIITELKSGKKFIYKNLVCNKFYEMIADFFVGTSPNKLSYLAIGDGLTSVDVTDTSLDNEIARVAFTTTATAIDQIHIQTEVDGATALFNWKELGLFNASTGGDMTNRVNIDYVHNSGDIVTVDWYIEKV